jgi:hypothetical protein
MPREGALVRVAGASPFCACYVWSAKAPKARGQVGQERWLESPERVRFACYIE